MEEIIKELQNLDGLELEVCGSWLWISGQTKENCVALKALGLRYAPKKQMWYYRPDGQRSRRHRPVEMEKIRFTYGSEVVA